MKPFVASTTSSTNWTITLSTTGSTSYSYPYIEHFFPDMRDEIRFRRLNRWHYKAVSRAYHLRYLIRSSTMEFDAIEDGILDLARNSVSE